MTRDTMHMTDFHKLYQAYTACSESELKDEMRVAMIERISAFGITLKLGVNRRGPVIDVWAEPETKATFLEGASSCRDASAAYAFIADEIDRMDAEKILEERLNTPLPN